MCFIHADWFGGKGKPSDVAESDLKHVKSGKRNLTAKLNLNSK
jgi:hypothetical protein